MQEIIVKLWGEGGNYQHSGLHYSLRQNTRILTSLLSASKLQTTDKVT